MVNIKQRSCEKRQHFQIQTLQSKNTLSMTIKIIQRLLMVLNSLRHQTMLLFGDKHFNNFMNEF